MQCNPFNSIVFLFFCVYFVQGSTQCPTNCHCNIDEHNSSTVWSCTSLTLSDLNWNSGNSEDQNRSFDTKHLTFVNSTINFEQDLSEYFPALESVEFSNCRINLTCNEDLLWLLNWTGKIVNIEEVRCSYPKHFNNSSVIKALNLVKNHENQCRVLKWCTCSTIHMYIDDDVHTSINCTNLQLKKLPELLPSNSIIHLDLSNNQIENLDELSTNPSYKQVTYLYLNNNRIKSLSSLEKSQWINNFNILNLQGNSLQEIPIEALSNAFLNNALSLKGRGFQLSLSDNPLKCDCLTTKHLQSFLAKHIILISDVRNIRCGPSEGVNAGKKVADVDLSSVCIHPRDNAINMMAVLNITLGMLIIFTVSKFIHDYYVYRKTGRLPWLATKLP